MLRRRCIRLAVLAALSVGVYGIVPAHAQNNMESELRDMTWVGFQQFQDASRVFVRTSDPVKYRVETPRDDIVELVLENTRVPVYNNTRYLPTQFFEGPVLGIQPQVIEGPSPSVRIEIRLRKKTPFRPSASGNTLRSILNDRRPLRARVASA